MSAHSLHTPLTDVSGHAATHLLEPGSQKGRLPSGYRSAQDMQVEVFLFRGMSSGHEYTHACSVGLKYDITPITTLEHAIHRYFCESQYGVASGQRGLQLPTASHGSLIHIGALSGQASHFLPSSLGTGRTLPMSKHPMHCPGISSIVARHS